MSNSDNPVGRLLEQLALERIDPDHYLGHPGGGRGRLFGGLVAAQSVVAACRTLPAADERIIHSLHAYFLRPGHYGEPIRFDVDRIRDGRTFTTRRVVAQQGGETLFNLSCSFAKPEEGLAHQSAMPAAPPPDDLPTWSELRARVSGDTRPVDHNAVDVRVCTPEDFEPGATTAPQRQRLLWMKPCGDLPDDLVMHSAALVYASDRALVSTALRPTNIIPGSSSYRAASLDHAMWFHRVPRFDDWILYVSESPVAHAARGLILGTMFTADGAQIASSAQEGLIRLGR